MDAVGLLESVCADAWPPLVDKPLGQWRLRAAGGFTGRANSALAVGDPGLPVSTALEIVESFARDHGIAPAAQVVAGAPVEADLAAAGWRVNDAHPKGSVVAVLTRPRGSGPGAPVLTDPPQDLFDLLLGGPPSAAQRHVLTTGPRVGFAVERRAGALAGVARGCVVGAHLVITSVEVAPSARRQGVALSLLAGLEAWAADADTCVLQVSVANEPALALYRKLGYTESHRYRYWIPTPQSPAWPATCGPSSPRA